MRKVLGIVLVTLLVVTLGYFVFKQMDKEDYSYVVVKINPEVELAIDSKEIVKEVITLNDDADVLISDLNLVGKTLEEATKTLIDETVEIGKLENMVEITVMNKNEDDRLKTEEKLREKVEEHIQTKNYNAMLTIKGVTEDIKTKAEEYEVTNGKMLLVSKALELNKDLKEEDLVKKSVKEIQEYIKEASKKRKEQVKEEKKQTKEEQTKAWEQTKEQLKEQIKLQEKNENEQEEQTQLQQQTQNQQQNQTGRN